MEEKIKELKVLLTAERFIMTGSYALSLMGLVNLKTTQDLDIILVKPTEEALSIMKRLMEEQPAKTKPSPYG